MPFVARLLPTIVCAVLAGACASYRGSATDVTPAQIQREAGWVGVHDFPGVRQRGDADCGAAALSSVLAHYGYEMSPERIESALRPEAGKGLSAGALAEFAKQQGLEAFVFNGAVNDLVHELSRSRPVIVGVAKPHEFGEWRAHYEVVLGFQPVSRRVLTFDPARGLRQNSVDGFLHEWDRTGRVALVMFEDEDTTSPRLSEPAVVGQNAAGAQRKMQSHHTKATIGAD